MCLSHKVVVVSSRKCKFKGGSRCKEKFIRRDGWITSVCAGGLAKLSNQNVIGCVYIQVSIFSIICSLPNVTHKLLLARSLDCVHCFAHVLFG